jgi:hypothetical protein
MTLPEPDANGLHACPVCGKQLKRQGFYPHVATHERAAEPTPKPSTKKRACKISVEDACIALLTGAAGLDSIPTAMLPEIMRWMHDTSKLIERLR